MDEMQRISQYPEAIAAGLSDAEAGRVIDHAEVEGWLATWGSDHGADPPCIPRRAAL